MKAKFRITKTSSAKEIIAFSLVPFGMFLINSTVYTVFNFYMTDVIKLNMALVSVVLLGSKFWDAVNDPIMGGIVEKTRTKWGKCRPYLLWTPLPLAIITALLFLPIRFSASLNIYDKNSVLMGNGGNFVYVLIMYMLYVTAYTALEIPYNSLTPLVFPNKDKRVRAVSVSNTLGSLGTVLPTVLIWVMIGFLGNGQKDVSDWGYFWSALIFSLMGAVVIALSFFHLKEKVKISSPGMSTRNNIKTIFKDRNMLILIACAFFSGFVNVGSMFLPYFARWNSIGILPMEQINTFLENAFGKNPNLDAVSILPTVLSVMSGISYMLSMLIIPPMLKKMTKKQLWIWMSLLGAAANLIIYFIGVYLIPYNTLSGFIVYALLRFFTNFPVGMSLVLLVSMFADVTDYLEFNTRERLEATSYSFKGLSHKIAIAFFNVVLLQIINALGYNAEAMERLTQNVTVPLIQSTTKATIIEGINYTTLLNGIFFMLTAAGAVGLLLQAIPMFFLKFDENEVQSKIDAYRAEKDAELQKQYEKGLEN